MDIAYNISSDLMSLTEEHVNKLTCKQVQVKVNQMEAVSCLIALWCYVTTQYSIILFLCHLYKLASLYTHLTQFGSLYSGFHNPMVSVGLVLHAEEYPYSTKCDKKIS